MNSLFGAIDFKEKLRERDTIITIVLLVLFVVGFGGYKIYNWHIYRVQSFAQKAFSESMEIYKQAIALEAGNKDHSPVDKTKNNLWDEVEVSFKLGYEQNKKSTLAPFFLAFESDAQMKLGKFEEAYNNLNEAVNNFSKNSPYFYLYSIKQAVFEIDKKDEQKGVAALNNLVNDKNNIFKDMAAFYLGEYFWSKNNVEKAKEQYQNALAYNPESTWGNLAKIRLERLG